LYRTQFYREIISKNGKEKEKRVNHLIGCHLVAHLACLLLRLLGPISSTPHQTEQAHTHHRLLPLISYRSNLLPAMNQDGTEELLTQQSYLMFCGSATSDLTVADTARPFFCTTRPYRMP
jgi:hypothetical protein